MNTETSKPLVERSVWYRLTNGAHFMFDFETNGLDPRVNAVIEIGVQSFTLNQNLIQWDEDGRHKSGDYFNLAVAPWFTTKPNPQTIDWHNANEERLKHYQSLVVNGIPADKAFSSCIKGIEGIINKSNSKEGYFWSKPSYFDWEFWTSHLYNLGLTNPFHRRNVMDVRSFVSGLAMCGNNDTASEFVEASFAVGSHKALDDARMQVLLVYKALSWIC